MYTLTSQRCVCVRERDIIGFGSCNFITWFLVEIIGISNEVAGEGTEYAR